MISMNRVLSGILATSLLSSGTPAALREPAGRLEAQPVPLAASADEGAGGKIEATLRLDFAQEEDALTARGVTAVLERNGRRVDSIALGNQPRRLWDRKNLYLIDFSFGGLERGDYTLTLTGTGYKTYTEDITIGDYSKHLTLGTGDSSFTLGDLNKDNAVDEKDVAAISAVLKEPEDAPAAYDLNGDGEVDVIDLAIVNHSAALSETGRASLIDTEWLPPASIADNKVTPDTGTTITAGDGDAALDIAALMDRKVPKTLERTEKAPISETTPVTAEVDLGGPVDMSQIELLTAPGDGEIKDGTITILYDDEDGREKEAVIPFTNQVPDNIQLLDGNGEDVRTVVIHLGKRVPVKKITISVTQTTGGEYASVAAVTFLADIVPENPMPANVSVCGLHAEAGNEQVALQWMALPNVTDYEIVSYLSDDGETDAAKKTYTNITSATITGLENRKLYTFKVTPVSMEGSEVVWSGRPQTIEAKPETTKRPAKVNMVTVKEGDGQLTVSWKAGKEAETYNVQYSTNKKADGSPDMTGAKEIPGITGTSTTISGLQNGTTYYITVTASNRLGEGPPSNVVSGTPKAVSYEVELPTKALLERSKIASVKLVDPSNAASGSSIDNVMDDNYQTHWTARDWYHNEHIDVTFTEPVGLSAALWVPRLDGNYPNWLRVYAVRVWTDADHGALNDKLIVPDEDHGGRDDGATGNSSAMQTWPNVRNNPSQNKVAILPFGPLEGITRIQVAVEQVGYNLTSCSELKFVVYDAENDIPTKIDALFSDSLHTRLNDDVTEAQVAQLESLLDANRDFCLYPDALKDDLALARELLGGGETGGVVKRGVTALTTGVTALTTGASVLQPLGVTANANTQITVYADIPAGETVDLYATQANAEASAWRTSLGSLVNGRNVITVPRIASQAEGSGGSLYFTYSGTKGSEIGLHVRRATPIPTLDVADWYQMSEEARADAISDYLSAVKAYRPGSTDAGNPKNVTEISTPSVLLSLPVTAVPSGATVASIRDTILAWEQIMNICRTTHGMDFEAGTTLARQNVRCMQMFEGAFMYAAGSHIGIGAGSCPGMLSGRPVPEDGTDTANGLFGWGIAHEIGHNMDTLGRAEITNNIYAITVQTFDGKENTLPSRLELSRKYAKIFTKTAQAHPGASNDVFVQLGMYWQLHLAYDDGEHPLDFYNRFFKEWGKGQFGSASTYDEKVAVIASRTANANLTGFFERWGMTLSDAVKNELKQSSTLSNESRAVWYLNDQSRRDRLAGKTPAAGSITVAATVENDQDVKLEITPDITDGTSGIQGYEIRRDGTVIDFVEANGNSAVTYTDHIGSANHVTFPYAVTAYDTLGNVIDTQKSVPPEVRIAYDMTVPASGYDITIEDGTATVSFHETTPISGLKLVGTAEHPVPESGAYSVTAVVSVKGEGTAATEKPVTARSDNFSTPTSPTDAGCYLTYFNKPGASGSDTRIWTYDAKTLTITGIPSGFTEEQVQIVSYAGDDVAFYQGAEVGILAHDYNGIKAGTLVVVGTYRGSPVYSSIFVEGQFTRTTVSEEGENVETSETRNLAGEMYLFAEVHEDTDVSDISDGLFVFVPNVQQEQALQKPAGGETVNKCDGVNLLPSRMRIVMKRSDDPNQAEGRETARTLWIETPGGTDLPKIDLRNN